MDKQEARIFDIYENAAACKALFEAIGDKIEYYDLSMKEPKEAIETLAELGRKSAEGLYKAFNDLLHLQSAERR